MSLWSILTNHDIIFHGFLWSSIRLTIHRYLGLFVTGIAFHYINPPVVAYIPQFNYSWLSQLLTLSSLQATLRDTKGTLMRPHCPLFYCCFMERVLCTITDTDINKTIRVLSKKKKKRCTCQWWCVSINMLGLGMPIVILLLQVGNRRGHYCCWHWGPGMLIVGVVPMVAIHNDARAGDRHHCCRHWSRWWCVAVAMPEVSVMSTEDTVGKC